MEELTVKVSNIARQYSNAFKQKLHGPSIQVKKIADDVAENSEMAKLLVYDQTLTDLGASLSKITCDVNIDAVMASLDVDMRQEKQVILDRESAMLDKLESDLEDARSKLELEDNKGKAKVKLQIEKSNAIYLETEQVKNDLDFYKPFISDLCFKHGLRLDKSVSEEDMTIEDLKKAYEDSLSFMKESKFIVDTNAYNSLPDLTKEYVMGSLLLVAITPLFPFLIIGYICIIMAIRMSIKNNINRLVRIYSLLSINPREFGYVELNDDDLVTVSYEDERLQPLLLKIEEYMNSSDTSEQVAKLDFSISQVIYADIDQILELKPDFEMQLTSIKIELEKLQTSIKTKIAELRNNTQLLHEKLEKESLFLDTNFMMGYDSAQLLPRFLDIGNRNIIIRYNSVAARDSLLNLLIVNFFGKVKPRHVRLSSYDAISNNLPIVGLYSENATQAGVTNYYTENFTKNNLIDINNLWMRTAKRLGVKKTISSFNEDCMTSGLTPIKYGLNLIISSECALDAALIKTIETSAKFGEYMVYCQNADVEKPEEDLGTLVNPAEVLILYADKLYNEKDAITMSETDLNKFRDILDEGIESSRSAGLPWVKFIDNFFQKKMNIKEWTSNLDNLWLFDSLNGVDVYPGYKDGDPNEMIAYPVGSDTGNPHALWAGASGAGKSVYINQVVNSWAAMYSPERVEFIFIDFKGGTELTIYSRLPHTRAVVASEDVSYALTLFKALQAEMNYRNTLLNSIHETFKPKSMVSYNQWFLKSTEEEKQAAHEYASKNFKDYRGKIEYMKRMVVVADEFQVPFTEAKGDQKSDLKQMVTNLSKVGRSVGIVLVFCSQSMDGTMDADVLSQFTARICLRVKEANTSKSIIGHDLASTITDKFGLCYAGDSARQSYEQTYQFKTPYLDEPEILDNIERICARAKRDKLKFPPAISYNQKTIEWLDTNKSQILRQQELGNDTKDFMFYGKLMEYTKNILPYNLQITYGGTYAMASDIDNYIDIFRMLKLNQDLNNHKVMIHCVNKEMSHLLHLDEIKSSTQVVLEQPFDKFLDVLDKLNSSRSPQSDPLFIYMIGYDQLNGIGMNPDRAKVNRLVSVINNLKLKNVEVIIMTRITMNFPMALLEIMDTKITTLVTLDASRMVFKTANASVPVAGLQTGFIFISSVTVPNYIAICKIPLTLKTRQATVRTLVDVG